MGGYIGASAGGVANAAERKQTYTITTATTSLTGLAYTPTKVHVFHNGVRLVDGTDYTATNGTSITLTNAAQNGDEVVVISYPSFQTSDTVSAANGGTFAGNVAMSGTLGVTGATTLSDDLVVDTDTLFVDASANKVGVGTASPQQLIDASAASADARIRVHSNTNSTPSAGIELMRGTNTTFGADAYTDFRIENVNGGHLAFSTGTSGATAERVRILAGGRVHIGDATSSDAFSSLSSSGNILVAGIGSGFGDNAHVYNVGGFTGPYDLIVFRNGNGVVGTITINGSSTSYQTSSDYRLKENVVDISDGITRVKQLSPKRFNFIADADTTVDGFLAHEAQAVVPEAVSGTHNEVDDDGNAVMQGIDQAKLVPLLTAALQEAIAKIETLETKVAALEAE